MENLTIRLIAGDEYVLTLRNEDNSKFYIKEKSVFKRELELLEEKSDKIIISTLEGVKSEFDIINMIISGIEFYTYDRELKLFTKVMVVDGHIKTIANDTEIDNITKLPIFPTLG